MPGVYFVGQYFVDSTRYNLLNNYGDTEKLLDEAKKMAKKKPVLHLPAGTLVSSGISGFHSAPVLFSSKPFKKLGKATPTIVMGRPKKMAVLVSNK